MNVDEMWAEQGRSINDTNGSDIVLTATEQMAQS